MAAYMVVFAKISDREKFFQDYAKPTAALIGKFGGKYLVRTPKIETLEGGIGEGFSSVVSEWPDRDAIQRFWLSEDYQKLKAARQPLADCHVFIVENPA